jgi:hypothetical protein
MLKKPKIKLPKISFGKYFVESSLTGLFSKRRKKK